MFIGVATLDKDLAAKFTEFHSMPWIDGGSKTAFRGELISVPFSPTLNSSISLPDGSRVFFDGSQGAMIRAYSPSAGMTAITQDEYTQAMQFLSFNA